MISYTHAHILHNTNNFPGILEHGDSIIYNIINDNIKISTIFEVLQDQRETLIEEWSLQQTTLESVFLKIAKKSEKQEREGKHDEEEEGHDESV